MLRGNDCDARPEVASTTVTFTVAIPLSVGIPEMSPEEAMLRPAGKPVAEKVYG
jgi:hypothetical protein